MAEKRVRLALPADKQEEIEALRKRLAERKAYRVIAEEEDCSYDTIKRKLTAIRNEIRGHGSVKFTAGPS